MSFPKQVYNVPLIDFSHGKWLILYIIDCTAMHEGNKYPSCINSGDPLHADRRPAANKV